MVVRTSAIQVHSNASILARGLNQRNPDPYDEDLSIEIHNVVKINLLMA